MLTLAVNEVVLLPSVTFTEIEVVLTVPVTDRVRQSELGLIARAAHGGLASWRGS